MGAAPWLGDLLLVLWLVTVLPAWRCCCGCWRRGWRGAALGPGAAAAWPGAHQSRRGQPEELVAAVDDGLAALPTTT